jgi:uncharacterized damage-inducible protein DinB
MELRHFFLKQLEREAKACRKVLERVPEGQNRWKPHERSVETRAELLGLLEEGLAKSRQALSAATGEHLIHTRWQIRMGGQTMAEGPRYQMIADGALSRLAHHRGQLTVYLRLNEAKVPALYGPSADEWQ